MSPALAGGFLTTAPPRKPLALLFYCSQFSLLSYFLGKFPYAFQFTEAAIWDTITSQAFLYSHFELFFSAVYVSQIRKKKKLHYEIKRDHYCICHSIFILLNFLEHLAQKPYVCMIKPKWSFATKIKPNFNRLNSACLEVIIISDFPNWFRTSFHLINNCISYFHNEYSREWYIYEHIISVQIKLSQLLTLHTSNSVQISIKYIKY